MQAKPWNAQRAELMVIAAGFRISCNPDRRAPRTGPELMLASLGGPAHAPPQLTIATARAIYRDLMHRHT